MDPDVPVNLTRAAPAAADVGSRLTRCGVPGLKLKASGDAVTPTGRLLTLTSMVPLNPLSAAAESEMDEALLPAERLRTVALAVSEKSGLAWGVSDARHPLPNPTDRRMQKQRCRSCLSSRIGKSSSKNLEGNKRNGRMRRTSSPAKLQGPSIA